MVGVVGFEPTAPCTPCRCATVLRYTPSEGRIAYAQWPFKRLCLTSSQFWEIILELHTGPLSDRIGPQSGWHHNYA